MRFRKMKKNFILKEKKSSGWKGPGVVLGRDGQFV